MRYLAGSTDGLLRWPISPTRCSPVRSYRWGSQRKAMPRSRPARVFHCRKLAETRHGRQVGGPGHRSLFLWNGLDQPMWAAGIEHLQVVVAQTFSDSSTESLSLTSV